MKTSLTRQFIATATQPPRASRPLIRVAAKEKRTLPGMLRLLMPLLLLLSLPGVVQAQFNYTTNNGTITITGYTGPGGVVAIPDMINGLPVASIGNSTFAGHTNLTSVTIPSSVTNIGGYAFDGCSSLTSVTIPSGVTSIGDMAFSFCTSLTAIIVDGGNSTYGSVDGVLFDKSQTTLILCPGGKTGSYTIPGTVTSMGDGAFAGGTSLTSVTIPSSVTNIGVYAFSGGTSLTAIIVDQDNSSYGSVDGVLFNKSQTTLILCPGGKTGSYTIPGSVISIGDGAFAGGTSLSSLTISDSVTSIRDGAFGGCSSLTNITIGNGVTSIGVYAFSGCTSLTSVTIPGSVTNIGDSAFYFSTGLTNVTIGKGVTIVGNSAFADCPSLVSVTIPDSVTSIGEYALYGCSSLTSVTFGNGVTNIGGQAFAYCTNLTIVTFGNGAATIGIQAFIGCTSLTDVTIGNGVTSIGNYAFIYCTSLKGVNFQGNAPSVGSYGLGLDNTATVYYLPGTTGWGATFGRSPTAFWSLPYPLILDNSPSFGVRTNAFGFIISWATNLPVVVEASTSLVAPAWTPVATNTLTAGASYFSDPQWTNYPNRFYRLRSP